MIDQPPTHTPTPPSKQPVYAPREEDAPPNIIATASPVLPPTSSRQFN